ncbi:MAG: hypothetical protein M0R06_02055 [Sphaerochaeta sp.]|jgi:hypothetical protein|nr:hypothetical protein [Sphaerochaeta sp.]
MSFLTQEEQYAAFGFDWKDGGNYDLTVRKNWSEGEDPRDKHYELEITDVSTGAKFTKRWEFNLMREIQKLGDAYKDNETVVNVSTLYKGKNENGYDVWEFSVRISDVKPSASVNEEKVKVDTELGF